MSRKSAVEATEMVCAPLEENAVSYRTCKKQRFKAGNFNLEDDDRSGASRKFDNGELEKWWLNARRKIGSHRKSDDFLYCSLSLMIFFSTFTFHLFYSFSSNSNRISQSNYEIIVNSLFNLT